MTEPTPQKFEQWAIVDLFGHTRVAGFVTEQTIGGCSFVRVDVPEIDGRQAFTRLFGQGAIYGITFVTEATARLAAKSLRSEPISAWDLPESIHKAVGQLEFDVRRPGEGDPDDDDV